MATLSKKDVEAHIAKIAQMGGAALLSFRQMISMSNADSKAKGFLYRACDARAVELDRSTAMVVAAGTDDFKDLI